MMRRLVLLIAVVAVIPMMHGCGGGESTEVMAAPESVETRNAAEMGADPRGRQKVGEGTSAEGGDFRAGG